MIVKRFLVLGFLATLSLNACRKETASPCEGRQWKNSEEHLNCQFPNPPIGRWHAVYTKDFANKHDLPLENISKNLPVGIDYMEMDVQPYRESKVACLVNMLVKKPHDIALYNLGKQSLVEFSEDRKLLQLIDIEKHKSKLEAVTTFNSASRDYYLRKRGYRSTTFSMFIKNPIEGYDYISANTQCRLLSIHADYFPDGYAFWVHKASVWGKYHAKFPMYENPLRPKGMDFYNSLFFINIPEELILTIFKDVPIGGR